MTYEKSFKEEAVKLSDEIGLKKASEQLGIPYNTLADWRHKQNIYIFRALANNMMGKPPRKPLLSKLSD